MRWTVDDIPEQHGRVAVITGANSGIGYETAKALGRKGAHVVLGCRSPERGEAARERLRTEAPEGRFTLRTLDLSALASVTRFAEDVLEAHDALHLLINNAGVMVPPYAKTADGFELQMGVNHLGHFALTAHLAPRLVATDGARLVQVASTAHRWGALRFDDLHWERRRYSAWLAYGASKLANLLFARELTRRLGSALRVASAHPGYTATNLQRHTLPVQIANPFVGMSAAMGALPTLYAAVADDVRPDDYFGPDGLFELRGHPRRVSRARRARDDAAARRLWEVSEEATGVAPRAEA